MDGSAMRPGGRRRGTMLAVASLVAHAGVLAVLAFHAPRLHVPPLAPSGPPEPIIPILLMPRALPPSPTLGEPPTQIRLHRRPQRFRPEETDVAPLVAPMIEVREEVETEAVRTARRARAREDRVAADVQRTLQARLGCGSANLMDLTRAERDGCEDRFITGGRQADFPELGAPTRRGTELDQLIPRRSGGGGGIDALGLGGAASPPRIVVPADPQAGR